MIQENGHGLKEREVFAPFDARINRITEGKKQKSFGEEFNLKINCILLITE